MRQESPLDKIIILILSKGLAIKLKNLELTV